MHYPFCFLSCHSQEITNVINIYLVDIKLFIMYLMLYSALKLHIKYTLPYSNKVKNKLNHQISDHFQHCFQFMLHSRVSNYSFYSLFLNLSTLLLYYLSLLVLLCCCTKISPWWRLRKGGWHKACHKQGAWYYSENKIKYCIDTP